MCPEATRTPGPEQRRNAENAVGLDRIEGEAVARGQAIAFYGDDSMLSIDDDGEIFEAHLATARRSVIAPPRTPRRPRSRVRQWVDRHVLRFREWL